MKAIVYEEYGNPSVLKLKEVEKPQPKDNEVLIKVHAASINSWDYDLLRGKPYINRIGGLRKPRYSILGADIAGRVESIGKGVTHFRIGDEVFGDISGSGWGGFAEYVCAHENVLSLKSKTMTFEGSCRYSTSSRSRPTRNSDKRENFIWAKSVNKRCWWRCRYFCIADT